MSETHDVVYCNPWKSDLNMTENLYFLVTIIKTLNAISSF